MALEIEGQSVRGEFLRMGTTVNTMVDQLSSFADEVTRVAREVGTEGILGGQAEVKGVSGTWRDLTENVNFMASNLTTQVRTIAAVTTAVAEGDLSRKVTVEAEGEMSALAETINTMVDQLSSFADEVTRVAREVGTEGNLGGQAQVKGVSGTWRDLTENVNSMASNLTSQVRNIAQVATAVAKGDLSQKVTGRRPRRDRDTGRDDQHDGRPAVVVRRRGDRVGARGRHRGQPRRPGAGEGRLRHVAGPHRERQLMAGNLTSQVRNIAQVTTGGRQGDLSQKITVDAKGEDGDAGGHDQHDGRPAVVVRRRGHPRGPRGRHGGDPRRPGPRRRRLRDLARPDRERELHGVQPDQPGADDRRRDNRGRPRATSPRRSRSRTKGEMAELADTIT
jgi:HAMP domain-containing protein